MRCRSRGSGFGFMSVKCTSVGARRMVRLIAAFFLSAVVSIGSGVCDGVGGRAWGDDWPTFRHDQRRSGVTSETIDASTLRADWQWRAPSPPASAWPDAAKWDAYATLDGLRSMRDYDSALHPIVVGDRLFLPGNADDTVRCLSAETGELLWQLTVEAPVRIAPTYHDGLVYFGCDDGAVYAADASTGELRWRTPLSGLPSGENSFLNNGRICSLMPVRSGVLIDAEAGTGVVAAGIFPWQATLLGAVDLTSGEIVWRQDLGTGWTLEGAMLLSPSYIIAPQGRSAPLRFERDGGRPDGVMSGGGGSFVVLSEDSRLFHGPGNKGGWITESDASGMTGEEGAVDKIASFDKGLAIVVRGHTAFLLDDRRLAAFDRRTGEFLWVSPCDCPHELILAGETLFAGGDDEVLAYSAADGHPVWRGEVEGRAIGLAVASGGLFVSTDTGVVHRFTPGGPAVDPPIVDDSPSDFELAQGPGAEVVPEPDPDLLHRWVFRNGQAELGDSGSRGPWSLRSAAPQGVPLEMPPGSRLVRQGDEHALRLDGRTAPSVVEDFRAVPHPDAALTVEAFVRIDQPLAWGGICSVMQDNGAYEKGWILGYRDRSFGFAVNGREGPDRLTWVTDPQGRITEGTWYHVAATYDGTRSTLYLDGEAVAVSEEQSGAIDYPRRAGFHLGAYRDDDEHFLAEGMLHEVRVYRRGLAPDEIARHAAAKLGRFESPTATGDPQPSETPVAAPVAGPVLKFVGPGAAEVRWTTATPQPTRLRISEGEAAVTIAEPETETTEHFAALTNLRPQAVVKFRIIQTVRGRKVSSEEYECDTHFDYSRRSLPPPTPDVEAESARAERWVSGLDGGNPRGIGVVWGCADEGRFAESLARLSGHDVIVVEEDREQVEAARRRLADAGVYGRVVAARMARSAEEIGLPAGTANWLWVDPHSAGTLDDERWLEDALTLVRPRGVVAVPGSWERGEILSRASFELLPGGGVESPDAPAAEDPLAMDLARAPRHDGAAGWTHMYGTADNAAYAGETLSGVRHTDDLRVAWAGRPGPRYQSDRGNRKPSPLAADGRLYLQGLRRTIGIDAHNGSILWALELPEIARFNVPRDCSNWCADEQNVYIAARHRCLVIDGRTGEIGEERIVPNPEDAGAGEEAWEWGYVARPAGLLVGSAVRQGAAFKEFWGPENWYDSSDGEHAKKVCSDFLFGLDAVTGDSRWLYRGGLVVNPTITIADGRIHFVECRSSQAISAAARRLDGDDFWANLHLVTLDLQSGERLWETPAKPMEGQSAFYLVAAEGRLLMQSSRGGVFAMYAFDSETGEMLWRGRYDWEADHHGKHLSRPAVVEGRVYLRPLTLDLADGSVVSESFPDGHQCGTYTASRDALFLRAGNLTVWDRVSDGATRWDRLRPDCWISTIPAEGMLLSPEGGGGCSCGGWIETSIGFAPRWRIR